LFEASIFTDLRFAALFITTASAAVVPDAIAPRDKDTFGGVSPSILPMAVTLEPSRPKNSVS
jgi:hypothetical protein